MKILSRYVVACFAAAVLGVPILLFTGCGADKTDIEFSSSEAASKFDTNSSTVSPPKKISLPETEERKIELAVFSDLLSRHFWDDGGYSAIFLQADDDIVSAIQKKFPGRKPPVKETYRINVQPNLAPRDKDTDQAAMILSVDIGEPEDDGSVAAIGKWYAGGAVTGFYTYQLKKTADDWQIQNAP
ncbi:MAG TPA: hypothetical protein VK742_13545 [Candidatus Sulfotelmatobacter sp.]|jgi:hypothetical protein|nr:hypothetical protein [Candidatus Sulfotelmatobacter sp.]